MSLFDDLLGHGTEHSRIPKIECGSEKSNFKLRKQKCPRQRTGRVAADGSRQPQKGMILTKKGKKDRTKKRQSIHTPLTSHKRVGKTLVPPMASLPTQFSSWQDDHAPEMLWALLLASSLPRDAYLGCFREVISWAQGKKDLLVELNPPPPPESQTGGSPCEIDLTGLGLLPSDHFNEFVRIRVKHPLGYGALRPLVTYRSSGSGRWA